MQYDADCNQNSDNLINIDFNYACATTGQTTTISAAIVTIYATFQTWNGGLSYDYRYLQQLTLIDATGTVFTHGTTDNLDETNVVEKAILGPIMGIETKRVDDGISGFSEINFLTADPCDPVVTYFPVSVTAGESTTIDLKYYGQHYAYWTPQCIDYYALSLTTSEWWMTITGFSLTLAPPATTPAASYSLTLTHVPLPSTTATSTTLSVTILAGSTCLVSSFSLNPHSLQGTSTTMSMTGTTPLVVPFPSFT